MNTHTDKSERHQHQAPQCKSSDQGTICAEESCRHDKHVSKHVEVSCTPVEGQSNLYDCVHQM